jgi:hypothetical protein
MMPGPAAAIAALLPTKSPAPMIPPIEIIVTWRERRLRLSPLSVVVEASVAMLVNRLARDQSARGIKAPARATTLLAAS